MSEDELAEKADYTPLVKEFVELRQWCKIALKEPFPELIENDLLNMSRNFSCGLFFAQDIKNATYFVEQFREIKRKADSPNEGIPQ